ncbi:carbohydrate ABC transporter permease [Jiangella endophytica]|uniref:carbohydrate ABC transporter permease n=1 Tax=Jiangella endophytica TaxID=1623398 RepID=UPI000E341FBE|nr:carbohydrate ABC transporter permease [Jiangella endophytica]
MNRRSRTLRHGLTYLVLGIAAAYAIFPLLWVVLTSLKNNRDAIASADRAFDFTPTWSNYSGLFDNPAFLSAALTSFIVTVAATALVVVIATLGGYAFARLRLPGRRTLASLMVIVQVIPIIVLVIPLFRIVSEVGLYDRSLPLVLIMTGLNIPFATWLMLAFFRSSPVEIEEAAAIDGASRFQLFRQVLIPIVAPGMATAAIFTAIEVWNAFLVPLVLGQSEAQTLTVYASQFITYQEINWGPLCATAVLIFAPIVLFVLALQRPLVKGITTGSVK